MRHVIIGFLILISSILTGCTESSIPEKLVQDASIPVTSCKIIALGDSLTAGYMLPPEEAYPAQLEKKLLEKGYNCRVINAGVSGDTSKNLLDRLEFTLGNDSYNLAILVIGGNDGLRTLPVEEMKKNIAGIFGVLKNKNIPVMLGGMQMPANAGMQGAQFKQVYPDLANEYKIPLLPFFLEGVAMNPQLNISDGIHPNADGYAIISNNVIDFIEKEKLLKK